MLQGQAKSIASGDLQQSAKVLPLVHVGVDVVDNRITLAIRTPGNGNSVTLTTNRRAARALAAALEQIARSELDGCTDEAELAIRGQLELHDGHARRPPVISSGK